VLKKHNELPRAQTRRTSRSIHFCLGAPLAGLEANVALNAMLDRLPGRWQVAQVPLEMIQSYMVFGPKRLPLTWGA